MTRGGWLLAGTGSLIWASSPLLWVAGKLALDVSLFVRSTALPAPDDVLGRPPRLRGPRRRARSGRRAEGELVVGLQGVESRLALSAPVARALVEALRAYHDPRERGRCDHCGGGRLDENFLCGDCGRPSGLFGQLVSERAARHTEQGGVQAAPAAGGRHARADDR